MQPKPQKKATTPETKNAAVFWVADLLQAVWGSTKNSQTRPCFVQYGSYNADQVTHSFTTIWKLSVWDYTTTSPGNKTQNKQIKKNVSLERATNAAIPTTTKNTVEQLHNVQNASLRSHKDQVVPKTNKQKQ